MNGIIGVSSAVKSISGGNMVPRLRWEVAGHVPETGR